MNLSDVITACDSFTTAELLTLPVFNRKGKLLHRNPKRLLKVLTARINIDVFASSEMSLRILLDNTAGCLSSAVRIIARAAKIAQRTGETTIRHNVINSVTYAFANNIMDRLSGGDYAFLFLLGTSECEAVSEAYPAKLAEMIQSGAVIQYPDKSVRVLPPIMSFISSHPYVLTWSEASIYAKYMDKVGTRGQKGARNNE